MLMMTLKSLIDQVSARVQALTRREAEVSGAISTLSSDLAEYRQLISGLLSEVDVADRSKAVLEAYAVEQQNDLQSSIEDLCTRGLQTVFQQPLEFKMDFKIMRGQPEVSFSVVSYINGDAFEMDIPNSFGGGLAVVCAVLLRIIVLKYLVEQGKVSPVLILDEPLAALSPSYPSDEAESLRSRMASFLRAVCDELNVQIILVTHEPDYGDEADSYYVFKGGLGNSTTVVRGLSRD